MAKMTLLEMTQDILSEMSSDEVNSIGDTTESLQVANIIKGKYRDILTRINIPEHEQLFQLVPSTDETKPVVMTIPDEVSRVDTIKYFNSNTTSGSTPGYTYVTLVPNRQFFDMANSNNPNDTDVDFFVFTDNSSGFPSSFNVYYRDDRHPCYATIVSNSFVIFDAYDQTQDDTLQASKTMCMGQVTPVFLMEDNFIPDLDDKEFSLLFNEAKAYCFYVLKQMPNQKAEQEVKRQWTSVQKNKSMQKVPSEFARLPDFGRRRGAYSQRYA